MSSNSKDQPPAPDLTPTVGSFTDVAPLTHSAPKPAHELTADEDAQLADWDKIAATEEFKSLLKAKLKFIAPASVFFIVYYFALPVLVGYKHEWMEKQIFGVVNLAYVFALSQFIMAWTVAALYVRAAGRFDKMAEAILAKLKSKTK